MTSRPNAEQMEAAYIDALAVDRLRDLLGDGGKLIARKAEIDSHENLVMNYYVAMPSSSSAVKLAITVRSDAE